jgi:hypothetical protein
MNGRAWSRLAPVAALPALLGSGDPPHAVERLRDSCTAYVHAAEAVESVLCRAYVQGFLDGARRGYARDAAEPESGRESFRDRAVRTRLGRQRAQAPERQSSEFCLPMPAPFDEIVRDFQHKLVAQQTPGITTPAGILLEVLRRRFPCLE